LLVTFIVKSGNVGRE